MMAILHYDMPDDAEDYYAAVNGAALFAAIGDYSQKLRSMYKYEEKETISTYDARQLLYDTFIENNLNTDYL